MAARSAHHARDDLRPRLLDGVAGAVASRGCRAVAVEDVLTASGCARRSFYRHFATLDEAIAAAHAASVRRTCEQVTETWVHASATGLSHGLLTALEELVALVRAEPRHARFWLLEAPAGGGPAIWRQQARFADRLAAFARAMMTPAGQEPWPAAELFAAAIVWTLRERIASGDDAALERLPGDAMRLLARFAPAPDDVAAAAVAA